MDSCAALVFTLLLAMSASSPARNTRDDGDDRVIDLQELLVNVADAFDTFGKLIKGQMTEVPTTLNNFNKVMAELKIVLGEVKTASASLGTAGSDIKEGFDKSVAALGTFDKNMAGHFEKSSESLNGFGKLLNDHLRQSTATLNIFGNTMEDQNRKSSASFTVFGKMIENYFKNSTQTCSLGGGNFDDLKATLTKVKEETGSIKTTVQDLKGQIQGSSGNFNVLVQDHREIKDSLANIKSTTDSISNLSKDIKNTIGTCSSSITEFIKEQNALKDKINQGFENIKDKIETSCSKGDGGKDDDKDNNDNNDNDDKRLPVKDCADIYNKYGYRTSGKYNIKPDGYPEIFAVRCDMDTDGGGWTVIQKRGDFGLPQDYFYKTWNEYKNGFGNVNQEFWLGNDRIAAMTKQGNYQLRIDLLDMDSVSAFAKYNNFKVDNEASQYKLTVIGYRGTAGDSLSHHNGMRFSTKDRDNDLSEEHHCAANFNRGAWWYRSCYSSNLNGLNLKGINGQEGLGIEWLRWKGSGYSLAATEMKIRPRDF